MIARIRSVIGALFGRHRFEEAMRHELQFHIESFADDLERSGIPRAEALRRARLEFGAMESAKEECRQARGLRLFDELRQDLRYATRTMARAPLLTGAAMISLALGVGANTAIFGFVDAVFLRTQPIRNAHDLFYFANHPGGDISANYPIFERYRTAESVFSGVTAYMTAPLRVVTPAGVEPVAGQFVSGNYHSVLGVPIALGRGFSSEPDRDRSRPPIAVISDGYWASRFGRSPDAIGRTLTVGGRRVEIVGVTGPGFHGLESGRRIDITMPISVRAADVPDFLDDHDGWGSLTVIGRVREGIRPVQASATTDALFQQYMREPEHQWLRTTSSGRFQEGVLLPAAWGSERLRQQYATPLRVLMGMVGLVLLIACANVANLLLARAATRVSEVALRVSIGASRRRLIRQLLTESLLLSVCSGALGLLVSIGITGAILSLFEGGPAPVFLDVTMSVRVLLFTIGIATLTGVGFGLVPAFRATRVDAAPALKGSGKITPHGRRTTAGQVLVMAQIALCMVLIATAGLLGRSLVNLRTFDAGFEREHVLLFGVNMAGSEFSSDSRAATYSTLLDRLRGLPGVLAVSSSTRTPIDATASLRRITVPGFETPGLHGVSPNVITPDYLQNFGIGLLRGRALRSSDTNDSPKVAVVSQSMARFYFGGTDPIGRTFTLGDDNAATTVVGVVEDVRHERLRDQAPPKMVYTPLAQTSAATVPGTVTVAVRTSEHPAALAAAVRGEAGRVNPSAMVSYVRTMEQQLDAALVRERLLATLSAGFGMLALLLACVGLYGTVSYSVVRRSREISIRMALGAARMVVLRQILRESVTVTAAGVVIGTVAALWATRAVSAMLFDLSPRDPLTLASVAAILLTTALAAGFVPARKAASVEPATALRAD